MAKVSERNYRMPAVSNMSYVRLQTDKELTNPLASSMFEIVHLIDSWMDGAQNGGIILKQE